MMFSSQVCARSVMHEPSADWPCQLKTPSSWLQVITVPRRTMSTCRARRQGEPSDHAVERSGGPLTVAAAHREQEAVAGRVAQAVRLAREQTRRNLLTPTAAPLPPSPWRGGWCSPLDAPGSPSRGGGRPPPGGRSTGRPRPPSISAAACADGAVSVSSRPAVAFSGGGSHTGSVASRFPHGKHFLRGVSLIGRRAHLLGIGLDDLHLEHHGRRRPRQHHGLGLLRLLALTVEHVEVGLLATRQICSTIKLCH